MNLESYIEAQRLWSSKVFGTGEMTEGILRHMDEEVSEIRENPDDLSEWADVIILALDGMWRRGYTSAQIASALRDKQKVNSQRDWPENVPEGEPIRHLKEKDADEARVPSIQM